MTELYQQARQAGAISSPQVDSAGQPFEYCRERGIRAAAGGSPARTPSGTRINSIT